MCLRNFIRHPPRSFLRMPIHHFKSRSPLIFGTLFITDWPSWEAELIGATANKRILPARPTTRIPTTRSTSWRWICDDVQRLDVRKGLFFKIECATGAYRLPSVRLGPERHYNIAPPAIHPRWRLCCVFWHTDSCQRLDDYCADNGRDDEISKRLREGRHQRMPDADTRQGWIGYLREYICTTCRVVTVVADRLKLFIWTQVVEFHGS